MKGFLKVPREAKTCQFIRVLALGLFEFSNVKPCHEMAVSLMWCFLTITDMYKLSLMPYSYTTQYINLSILLMC